MFVNTVIEYKERYLPTPKCRKYRFRTVRGTVFTDIKDAGHLRLAFEDQYFKDKPVKIYADDDDRLWRKATERDIWACDTGKSALEALLECGVSYYCRGDLKEQVIEALEKSADKYRVKGETLFISEGEPMYCVATFGLGHNHGGTGLMTDYYYNGNISKERYFNANHGDEAVAEANRIAAARGDTNDVGRFRAHIKVYEPGLVKRDPKSEHGDGDPFLNSLEKLTETADSTAEAGLLALAFTASEINKKEEE